MEKESRHSNPFLFIKSQSGFGLIEVVIAAGIISILALGLMSLMGGGFQGAQSVQKRLSSVELQSFIVQTLNNSADAGPWTFSASRQGRLLYPKSVPVVLSNWHAP